MRHFTSSLIYGFGILSLLLISSCKEKMQRFTVEEKKITEAVYASGTIKAVDQYEVYAVNQGLIKSVDVKDGDLVKKGQVLFTLQDVAQKLTAENARLAADYALWNARGEKLEELNTNLRLAQKKLRNDSIQYNRQKELWQEGIGSRTEVEQRALAFETSLAAFESLTARLADARRELNFLKEQSKRQWGISFQTLNDQVIRSRRDGRVYQIKATSGEMAVLGRPLATIGAADSFYIELLVDEKDIAKIKLGQELLVRMDAYGTRVFGARVSHIRPLMDEKSRSFQLEATFTQAPPNLYPYLTVEANLIIAEKTSALVIPRSYLLNDSTVWLSNKQVKKVTTGLRDYQMIEILSGLKKGDTIYKNEE